MLNLSKLPTQELESQLAELRRMFQQTESDSFRQELLKRMEKFNSELMRRKRSQ